MSDDKPDRPNPTATAIAAWLRSVARDHRQAGEAKANLSADADRVGIDSGVLRAFAQANLNSAQLLDVLADQVEQRAWPMGYVHHLGLLDPASPVSGRTACGLARLPYTWPTGDDWSPEWPEVTCPGCLERRPAGKPFASGAEFVDAARAVIEPRSDEEIRRITSGEDAPTRKS